MDAPPSVSVEGPDLLRKWRRTQGLTQEDIGQSIGICHSQVSEWENRKAHPAGLMLLRLHLLTGGAVPFWAWVPQAESLRLRRWMRRHFGGSKRPARRAA